MAVSNLNFAADVKSEIASIEGMVRAVFRQSAQDVIEAMLEVGPSKANPGGAGTGRMPVDTGFLRASIVVRLNADLPEANMVNPGGNHHAFDSSAATLVINNADLDDSISAGFTAAYAPAVNYGTSRFAGYHFVEDAAGRWDAIFKRNEQAALNAIR